MDQKRVSFAHDIGSTNSFINCRSSDIILDTQLLNEKATYDQIERNGKAVDTTQLPPLPSNAPAVAKGRLRKIEYKNHPSSMSSSSSSMVPGSEQRFTETALMMDESACGVKAKEAYINTGKAPVKAGSGRLMSFTFVYSILVWEEESSCYVRKHPLEFVRIRMSSVTNNLARRELAAMQLVGTCRSPVVGAATAAATTTPPVLVGEMESAKDERKEADKGDKRTDLWTNNNPSSEVVLGCIGALEDEKRLFIILPYYEDTVAGPINEHHARIAFRSSLEGLRRFHSLGLCHHHVSCNSVVRFGITPSIAHVQNLERQPEEAKVESAPPRHAIVIVDRCSRIPYAVPSSNFSFNAVDLPSGFHRIPSIIDEEGDDFVADVAAGTLRRLMVGEGRAKLMSYMPPEMHFRTREGSSDVDGPAVDLWAAGVVLYTMITGYHPQNPIGYAAKKDQRYIERILDRLPEPEVEGTGCRHLLSWMFHPDPKERPSMSQVLDHSWVRQDIDPDDEILPNDDLWKELVELLDGDEDDMDNNFSLLVSDDKRSDVADNIDDDDDDSDVEPYMPMGFTVMNPMPPIQGTSFPVAPNMTATAGKLPAQPNNIGNGTCSSWNIKPEPFQNPPKYEQRIQLDESTSGDDDDDDNEPYLMNFPNVPSIPLPIATNERDDEDEKEDDVPYLANFGNFPNVPSIPLPVNTNDALPVEVNESNDEDDEGSDDMPYLANFGNLPVPSIPLPAATNDVLPMATNDALPMATNERNDEDEDDEGSDDMPYLANFGDLPVPSIPPTIPLPTTAGGTEETSQEMSITSSFSEMRFIPNAASTFSQAATPELQEHQNIFIPTSQENSEESTTDDENEEVRPYLSTFLNPSQIQPTAPSIPTAEDSPQQRAPGPLLLNIPTSFSRPIDKLISPSPRTRATNQRRRGSSSAGESRASGAEGGETPPDEYPWLNRANSNGTNPSEEAPMIPPSLAPTGTYRAGSFIRQAEIHDHDVIFARGGLGNNHPGNDYWRKKCKELRPLFVKSLKFAKRSIAEKVVRDILSLNPPGRFIQKKTTASFEEGDRHGSLGDGDNNKSGSNQEQLWVIVSEKKAVDKSLQRLREGAPELRAELGGTFRGTGAKIGTENGESHSVASANLPIIASRNPDDDDGEEGRQRQRRQRIA